jgi:multicomponent Na+:H+ antiporter subunit F
MDNFFLFASFFLGVTTLLCLIRVIVGPSLGDRIIGINVIGTKTIVLIAIIAALLKESFFIDVVLVYALISFIGSFVIAREINEASGERERDD